MLITPALTCFANAHGISISLCQASWVVYAWIVRQFTRTEALMAKVTSIKWRTDAYKLSLLNRFITGSSIQAWFRITFIYVFTAVWTCPSCCTQASEEKKKKRQHIGQRKTHNLSQLIPYIYIKNNQESTVNSFFTISLHYEKKLCWGSSSTVHLCEDKMSYCESLDLSTWIISSLFMLAESPVNLF